MKILVIMPHLYDTAPSSRFRIEQWARHLPSQGFEFTFAPFEDSALHQVLYQPGRLVAKSFLILSACLKRLRLLGPLKKFDVIFLHREAALVGPPIIERFIARQRVPLIYDFDDPIWLAYQSPTNPRFSRFKWVNKVQETCKLATRVVVGNRLLAEWASQHARDVTVIPSTIDLAQYPLKPPSGERDRVTLGWTGTHSTLPFLESIQGVLTSLACKFKLRVLIISHTDQYRLELGPAQVIAQEWRSGTEAADLLEMDIGLAPFPNTGWTPWRCHGKLLQYMAIGIPAVASPIGIVPEYIADGVNGNLAATPEEWDAKLTQLIEQPRLRSDQGANARRTIQESYSAQLWVPKVRELFESVASA